MGACFDVRCPPPYCVLFRKYVRCPPPYWQPVQKICAVSPPPGIHFFFAVSPHNLFLRLEQFGFVLDSKENWESGNFQLARCSQAQLVSSSVALLAELVCCSTFNRANLNWQNIDYKAMKNKKNYKTVRAFIQSYYYYQQLEMIFERSLVNVCMYMKENKSWGINLPNF